MNRNTKLFAMVGVAILLVSVLAPAVSASAAAANEAGNTSLSADVTQDTEGVTVNVTSNGTAADGATVNITASGNNTTYVAEGTTGPDGTVEFDNPEENVSGTLTVTYNNTTAEQSVSLDSDDAVEEQLVEESDNFGQAVSAFVHNLLSDGTATGGIGSAVSEFVTANNPGADNRPADAGPPKDAGPPEDVGPNADDGNETDDEERGPPEDAGPPEDTGPSTDDEDANETDDDDRGPPADAGAGNGNN